MSIASRRWLMLAVLAVGCGDDGAEDGAEDGASTGASDSSTSVGSNTATSATTSTASTSTSNGESSSTSDAESSTTTTESTSTTTNGDASTSTGAQCGDSGGTAMGDECDEEGMTGDCASAFAIYVCQNGSWVATYCSEYCPCLGCGQWDKCELDTELGVDSCHCSFCP